MRSSWFLVLLLFSSVAVSQSGSGNHADASVTPEDAAFPTSEGSSRGGVGRFFRRLFGFDEDERNAGAEAPETDESQAGTPETLTPEGDSGGAPDDVLSEEYKSASRPWEPPSYERQTGALDWSPSTFSVPAGLRARVDFWISIYSKYTTNQGILHDTVHMDVVYESLDFGPIMRDPSLSDRQKAKAREKLVDSRRQEAVDRLLRLAKASSAEGLEGEDLRVWRMFEKVDEPNKFVAAAKKGRVRFQLGQRDRFILGIYYSGRYIREMERIFREAGLPIELTRLPFVESSFNIFARSKVGASGVWQFMRRTARPYMMVNRNVDERDDPIEATRASAKMLKANHQLLGTWPLAVTGYNHGPNGVARIVKKTGTRDLTQIINSYSSRTFGFASENFFACFLAAVEVERQAKRYFGDVKWSTSFDTFELNVSKSLPHKVLLGLFDGDEGLARLHNFHLKSPVLRGRASIPKGTFIRVPVSMKERALAVVNGAIGMPPSVLPNSAGPASQASPGSMAPMGASSPRSVESLAAERSLLRPSSTQKDGPRRHRVKRGENLTVIAREYGISVRSLVEANALDSARHIRRGQWLVIPD